MGEHTKVFISYSHQDAAWLKRLQIHLTPLKREGVIDSWDDTRIQPGARWRDEISQALAAAKVAVLLVSPEFLASEFIAQNELPPLLAAAQQGGATILPVIVSSCRYRRSPLGLFQAVNLLDKPLKALSRAKQDEILVKLTEAIEDALTDPLVVSPVTPSAAPGGRWYVPLRPSPFFTGREALLLHLHKALKRLV